MLIGNIIIGLIEAFFVQKVFKIAVSYWIIVGGNYVSSIIGYAVTLVGLSDMDLLSISVLPTTLALLFFASVLIEWPFFVWAVKERNPGFSKTSFKYTFYAQCVSYALLIPYLFLTFDQGGGMSIKDGVVNDLNNLAAHAYQYRIRPDSMKGGSGAYTGYVIPASLSRTRVESIAQQSFMRILFNSTQSGFRTPLRP